MNSPITPRTIPAACSGLFRRLAFRCVLPLALAGMTAQNTNAFTINNNTGTWTDSYTDNLGVAATQQTAVDTTIGQVKLVAGQTAGNFTTVRIKPTSFSAWGALTLDGTTFSNTARARAANAPAVDSTAVITTIRSVPLPLIDKIPGTAMYALADGNSTRAEGGNSFTIRAENSLPPPIAS
jgi:hypothetical protein